MDSVILRRILNLKKFVNNVIDSFTLLYTLYNVIYALKYTLKSVSEI